MSEIHICKLICSNCSITTRNEYPILRILSCFVTLVLTTTKILLGYHSVICDPSVHLEAVLYLQFYRYIYCVLCKE